MPDKTDSETAKRKPRARARARASRKKTAEAKPPAGPPRVSKEILVNAGDLETRVAILEDGELAELYLEREPRIVGNIYNRTTRIVER